jgi:hypothetical protein
MPYCCEHSIELSDSINFGEFWGISCVAELLMGSQERPSSTELVKAWVGHVAGMERVRSAQWFHGENSCKGALEDREEDKTTILREILRKLIIRSGG